MSDPLTRASSPFNSPVEVGLRAMVLLAAARDGCSLRRLVVYDYLLVHSGDVDGGPDSLHPATPHRSGELLVRRGLIRNGLALLMSRELARVEYTDDSIRYHATELTSPFLAHLASEYTVALRGRAVWVSATFGAFGDDDLTSFAMRRLRDWGGEFVNESLVRRPPS